MSDYRFNYKQADEIFKPLKKDEGAIFTHYKDIFLLSACLGFKYGERVPLGDGHKEQIHWNYYKDPKKRAVINAIALIEKEGDLNILLDRREFFEEKIKIIEEYANSGFRILKNKILDKPGDPLDNLVEFIFQQGHEGPKGLIDELEDEF